MLLRKTKRVKKPKRKIPKTVQQSIPVDVIYKDGIIQSGKTFSKMWRFSDINYEVASNVEQEEMFLAHSAILNGLPTDAVAKISIYNRQLQNNAIEQMTLPAANNKYKEYAKELEELLNDKMAESNNIVHEKYITISAEKKNIKEARTYFARVGSDLSADFAKISSKVTELGYKERLRLFYEFFRGNEAGEFGFDLKRAMARGAHFKDYISPDNIEFKRDYIQIGDRYARVLFLKESMMVSVDVQPIPTDEAVKEIQKKLLAIETDITKWQQKQNMANNFSATVPYEMEQMRSEIKEFMDDLTARDQRMMFVTMTLVHLADSLAELDNDTETLMSIGRKDLCNLSVLKFQQEDGLNTVLPYGLMEIDAVRTLTTESTAVLIPYKTQEIIDDGGLYYGINAISHNLLMCNRKLLLNGNGFIIGVSGSGKSFASKMEIAMAALFTDDDIIVVDPEREYAPLVSNLGGEVIKLSASSPNHINAMDINEDNNSEDNPISIKSEFLISLFDQLLKNGDARFGGGVGAKDRSIIDRCTISVYSDYFKGRKCRRLRISVRSF